MAGRTRRDVQRWARGYAEPSTDLPQGEFWCTRLDEGSIRIDRADPCILISAELLDALAQQGAIADGTEAFALNARLGLLRIHGVNRMVIYRIGDYVPRVHGYIGEWPD